MQGQASDLTLKGAQQFPLGKGLFYEDIRNLYRNLAKGTTVKAQGTTAIAVGVVGYLEACKGSITKAEKPKDYYNNNLGG